MHDEFEIGVQLQGYDRAGSRRTRWDGSHDSSVAMEGRRLFRKDRSRR